jgi:hypothetical protein
MVGLCYFTTLYQVAVLFVPAGTIVDELGEKMSLRVFEILINMRTGCPLKALTVQVLDLLAYSARIGLSLW